jgi:predicted amidohydrolase
LGRPQANRTYFEAEINTISGAVDLIVLPEMFSTGFNESKCYCRDDAR